MVVRFCSLDQTYSECECNLVESMIQVVLLSPKSSEHQNKKKRSSLKIKGYLSPKSGED